MIYQMSGQVQGVSALWKHPCFLKVHIRKHPPNFISASPSVPVVDNELVVSEGISIDVTHVPFQTQSH